MKEKKANGVQLLLRAVVKDPEGKILSDTGKKPSKSLVIQFLEFIYAMFNFDADLSATATDGTEDKIYDGDVDCEYHLRVDAALNVALYGIVVGTGTTPETNTDYKLETQITEGTGAGQLTHGTTTIADAAVVGANVDLEVTRTFTNGSGNTITVTEAGIYTKQGAGFYHCIIRDVLGAGIDVTNKCSLSVIYTLRTTV